MLIHTLNITLTACVNNKFIYSKMELVFVFSVSMSTYYNMLVTEDNLVNALN